MRTPFQTAVGKQIRRLRLEKGLTIEELAFRAHLHPSYMGDIERGTRNPSLLNLKKVADSLAKPVSSLFEKLPAAQPTIIREKPRQYLSSPGMDRALTSLVKSLRKNSEKDQAYIIRSAKTLSTKLRKNQ